MIEVNLRSVCHDVIRGLMQYKDAISPVKKFPLWRVSYTYLTAVTKNQNVYLTPSSRYVRVVLSCGVILWSTNKVWVVSNRRSQTPFMFDSLTSENNQSLFLGILLATCQHCIRYLWQEVILQKVTMQTCKFLFESMMKLFQYSICLMVLFEKSLPGSEFR